MPANLATLAPHLRRLDGAPLTAARRVTLAAGLADLARDLEGAAGRIAELAEAGDLDGAAFCLADLLDDPAPEVERLTRRAPRA